MRRIVLALAVVVFLASCAPIGWLVRAASGRAALTRSATLQGSSSVAATSSLFAKSAVHSGMSVAEALAIRGAVASLLRDSPLRLSASRLVSVEVFEKGRLVLRGTLERNGRTVWMKDGAGGAVRVETTGESRARFWDAAGELAGEAFLDAKGSVLHASDGSHLGSDAIGHDDVIQHFDANGQLIGRSRISLSQGQPRLRLEVEDSFSRELRADLRGELDATSRAATHSDDPPKRQLFNDTLFVGGNLAQQILPDLNGLNAEADQRYVTSIFRDGGPSWATHRTLLRMAALRVDGDCRQAVSLAGAKVCSVAIAFRAPARSSFHLRDECPGATEQQALETCLARLKSQVREKILPL
jgi:hypothetical protein